MFENPVSTPHDDPKLMQSTYSVFYFLFSFWKCQSFQKKKSVIFQQQTKQPPLKTKFYLEKNHHLIIRDVVHELKTRAQKTNPWERLT